MHCFFQSRLSDFTTISGTYEQVDKLKVLSESLASSMTKAEKRISDHRQEISLVLHVPFLICSLTSFAFAPNVVFSWVHVKYNS